MRDIIRKLLLLTIVILLFKPFEGMSQYVYSEANLQRQLNEARNNVFNEKFNDAVAKYAMLVKNSDNKTVSAEYAYALALSGCYDGAIMNLDKIIASGQADKDVLFYTSQVLKLMEYDSIADLFWSFSYSTKSFAPSWISGQYLSFVEKNHYPATINTDDLGTALQRANKLAEQHQCIQALVLFLELIEVYPDEYLPFIGLSALMENLGYKKEAAKYLRKGIEKMGTDKYKIDPNGVFDKHLETLRSSSDNSEKGFQTPKSEEINSWTSRSFTHYGVSYINKAWAICWKYGYYSSETSFFTIGYNFFEYDKTKTHMIHLSCNSAFGKSVFYGGIDLSAQLSGGKFGFGVGPCVGCAIPLPGRKSSIDIYGVVNMNFQGEMISLVTTASIGYTRYF